MSLDLREQYDRAVTIAHDKAFRLSNVHDICIYKLVKFPPDLGGLCLYLYEEFFSYNNELFYFCFKTLINIKLY